MVDPSEFATRLSQVLDQLPIDQIGSVTGPGRSGAIASVYASHALGVPFVPYGSTVPVHLGRLLIIDTAQQSGRTLRKAERKYDHAAPLAVACFHEPPRVKFWYEM